MTRNNIQLQYKTEEPTSAMDIRINNETFGREQAQVERDKRYLINPRLWQQDDTQNNT